MTRTFQEFTWDVCHLKLILKANGIRMAYTWLDMDFINIYSQVQTQLTLFAHC